MRNKRSIGLLAAAAGALCFALAFLPHGVGAAESGMPLEKQAPLAPGTVITTQNWQQYKDYMPLWMQWLYSGKYFFKISPDQKTVVGPTIPKTLPKKYLADTEKYSGQVSLKDLQDGGTMIQNYTAGVPFPNPTEPHMGEKIIWNIWYRYAPRVEQILPLQELLIDRYHHIFRQTGYSDYMRLAHLSEPDQPINNPDAPNFDFTEYLELTEPEQSKYTVALTVFFLDPSRPQENWSFVPSLRRPLRLSAASRCSPALGTDFAVEDQKGGFNLQIPDFTAKVVAHKKLLQMNHLEPAWPQHVSFDDSKVIHLWGADTGIGWPPPPSKWELRDIYVVEVTRVPSKQAGYCYGLRRVYVDATDWTVPTQDLYDMSLKPWKILMLFSRMHPNGYGDYFEADSSNYVAEGFDLQNLHTTFVSEIDGDATDHYAQAQYYNVKRYAEPTGLLEVMK